MGGEEGVGGGFYTFLKKKIRSPGHHRPKYFMSE